MSEVTLNYEKIEWTYKELDRNTSNDTFNFNFKSADNSDTEEAFDPVFSVGDTSKETDIAMEEVIIVHEHIDRPHDTDVPLFDDFFA
ncbi:MAG: hypothetical protein AAFY05_24055 [Pseudomonadota bacterium]